MSVISSPFSHQQGLFQHPDRSLISIMHLFGSEYELRFSCGKMDDPLSFSTPVCPRNSIELRYGKIVAQARLEFVRGLSVLLDFSVVSPSESFADETLIF